MKTNYVMSDSFNQDAAKAVRKAIEKADELGLPKAYSEPPILPVIPVIQKIRVGTRAHPNQESAE